MFTNTLWKQIGGSSERSIGSKGSVVMKGWEPLTFASHHWGPEFSSRSLHVGFLVDETGSGKVFLGVSPIFPYHKFHSTISPHSSHPFRFISSALVMVRQAWSVGTLAIH